MKHAYLPLCLALLSSALPAAADPVPPTAPGRPFRPMMPRRPLMLPAPPPQSTAAAQPAAPAAPPPAAAAPLVAIPAQPPAKAAVHRPARPRPPPPPPVPAGPPPNVQLFIEAPTLHGAWTMRVTNNGSVPVRLAADARLLSLDVTPRGETKSVHCELPLDMRPDDDLDRSVVLPPNRSYSEAFEPRLYCFGERALQSLSPLSIVVARLGWPASSRSEVRQAVSAIDGIEPIVGSLPSLTSRPVALVDDPTPSPAPAILPDSTPADQPALRLSSPVAVDAQTLGDLTVAVTLRNGGSRPVRVRFKPETLAFDVTTSRGVEHCSWPTPVGAPMRELFSTLPGGGAETQSVLLSDYCNRKSFEYAGLVVVRPQLDTRRAGGQEIGIRTFDGQVLATSPTLIRLHKGTGSARLARPHLDEDRPSTEPSTPP